jgi:predicted alpha/beta superfamily hydrolase
MKGAKMQYRNILTIILFLWTGVCFSQNDIVIGQKHTIHSKILNEDRTYQVYLPQSYNWAEDRKYPVLFVLDGESSFIHTVGSVSFLSAAGEIPELIVIAINSTIRIRDFTQTDWPSHWIGGGGANNFKSFLSNELIPQVEKEYRTNGYRILSGHSAGGQFALYTLTSEPSLFNAYFTISPSLYWDDCLPQRSLEESFILRNSLKAFLYFAWSDDFGEALEFDKNLLKTLETKSPKGFRWGAKGFPDETHSSIPLLGQINALRQLFNGYRLHNDSLNMGYAYAEKHFKIISEELGYTIPVPEDIINNFAYEELDKGNIKEAINYFKCNVNQNPNSANAYDGLADGYKKAVMWNDAIAASQKAVELARKYNDPNLIQFIERTKKIEEMSKTKPEK